MLKLYKEKHYEVFSPQDARQVALFFDKSDAEDYLNWRNGLGTEPPPETEAEWLGNGEEYSDFIGTGLLVGPNGELAIVDAEGPQCHVDPVNDTEAGNLAAMIGAVLA